MKIAHISSGILLALAIDAGAAAAATTIYTDRAAYDIATGGSLNFEDFSDASFQNMSISSDAGFVTNSGVFRDSPSVGLFGIGANTTTYSFSTATTAFGGDFDLALGGTGTGLQFTLSNGEIVSQEINAPYDGFWGFVSDLSFASLTVSTGSQSGRAETHTLDNLSFGLAAPIAPVPLPAGLPLLLSALLGFFGLRRWSRRPHTAA
ncbi:hypothetical protein FHS72_001624 [Loktanella ponticola]|uniref:VPLPA-CTERM sorting domain-containing protein n=1 Tax=Yoonia ponticola TaxID=1524255 RepID=A0A7W9BKB4_9RHOB|nr:hypothetical protein [Yoonia ponticola]MBB5722000.1 hypothetical protein [Yoonia ponticola]